MSPASSLLLMKENGLGGWRFPIFRLKDRTNPSKKNIRKFQVNVKDTGEDWNQGLGMQRERRRIRSSNWQKIDGKMKKREN